MQWSTENFYKEQYFIDDHYWAAAVYVGGNSGWHASTNVLHPGQ